LPSNAAVVLAGSQRTRWSQGFSETGDAAADRIVQVPRRLQQAVVDPQNAARRGVVAFSSGNHAQGVAAAAKILNMRATIVMPSDAPLSKRERTKAYGAEVVLYDRDREDREAIANDIAGKHGATLVRPYDDPLGSPGRARGREIAEGTWPARLTPISWSRRYRARPDGGGSQRDQGAPFRKPF